MNKYYQHAILIILGLLIYSNTLENDFVFDDRPRIMNNETIKNFSSIQDIWEEGTLRPFGIFTFAMNYNINKLDVTGYHIVNIIIHI